jgi:AraC family ethanolamine operon transcriptional activator
MANSPPSIVTKHFASIESLEAQYSNSPGFRVVQLEKGPLDCRIYRLVLDQAIFEFRHLNTPLRIAGEKSAENLTFELVISPICDNYLSHGFNISTGILYGFDSGRGIDLRLPKHTLMGTLIIKKAAFQPYLESMGRLDIDQRLLSQNYVQIGEQFKSLQDYLLQLYSLVKSQSSFLDQRSISKILLEDYLPLLITTIPSVERPSQLSLKYSQRWSLVRQVESYLLNNLDQPITLKELCEQFYATKSPLSYAFQEVLGMSPLAYLKILRLHAIRRVLKYADPDTTIISLMHQFGFWHAGRFSLDYKKLFGESPSDTLKK